MDSTQKIIAVNPDSIEMGSAAKGSKVKVYGDFNELEEFKKKIDNAAEAQKYAHAKIGVVFWLMVIVDTEENIEELEKYRL